MSELTREELIKLYDELLEKSRNVFINKNKEYSKDKNPFSSFEESADMANCSVGQGWIVMYNKQYQALRSYLLNNKTFSDETIESRIIDSINYHILLYSMIKSGRLEENE